MIDLGKKGWLLHFGSLSLWTEIGPGRFAYANSPYRTASAQRHTAGNSKAMMKRRDGKWRPNEGFMDVKVLFVASPSSCVLLYKNDARGEEGDPLKGKRERKKEKSGQQKRKKRSPRDRNVKRDAIVTTGDPFLDDNHLPLPPPPPLPFCVDLKRETPQIFKWFPAQRWFKQREKVKDFLP